MEAPTPPPIHQTSILALRCLNSTAFVLYIFQKCNCIVLVWRRCGTHKTNSVIWSKDQTKPSLIVVTKPDGRWNPPVRARKCRVTPEARILDGISTVILHVGQNNAQWTMCNGLSDISFNRPQTRRTELLRWNRQVLAHHRLSVLGSSKPCLILQYSLGIMGRVDLGPVARISEWIKAKYTEVVEGTLRSSFYPTILMS